MPNYSTNLKTWGSTGSEYPDNYSYVDGEQPVDEWDNFFHANVVSDIEHLVDVTNNELLARDGSVDLQADLSDDNGATLWDYGEGYVPQESVEQGTDSGLNADMVDGSNVYVQSSAPSSPQAGDLWVDTS